MRRRELRANSRPRATSSWSTVTMGMPSVRPIRRRSYQALLSGPSERIAAVGS
jgi:hypothetical protein